MGCESPWTEKDEYGVYTDCHVWAPFYTIAGVFVIFGESVCAVIALERLRYKGRRTIPILIFLHSSLMAIVYIVRLSTGLVLNDKNVALNFFHGLSLSFLWVIAGLVPLQYLEVVLLTEKLKGKSLVPRVRIGFRIVISCTFFGCNFVFTAPCFNENISAIQGYWLLIICSASSYIVIIWYYGLSVRRLLQSMEVSKSFYAAMIKKLDFFLVPMSVVAVASVMFCAISLFVDVFYRNSYLMLNTIMASAASLCGFILYSSKPSIKDGDHSTSGDHGKSASHPVSAGTNPLSKGSPNGSKKEPGPSSVPTSQILIIDGSIDTSRFSSPILDGSLSTSHPPITSTTIPHQPASLNRKDPSPTPSPPQYYKTTNTNTNTNNYYSNPPSGRNSPLIEHDFHHIEIQQNKNKEKSYTTKGMSRMEDLNWEDPGLGTSIHRDVGHHLLLGGGAMQRGLSSSQSGEQTLLTAEQGGSRRETQTEWEKEEWNVQ